MATIQGIYVALFGRPADPTGLAFFNAATNNGANLNAIGDLAATKEYTDRFSGQTNTQIVNSIYQSLFGRDAEAAGLNFFVDALNKGTLNIKNIAIAILDGAQGTDKTIVDLKIASANTFTTALDTPSEIANYSGNTAANEGRKFLADVTTTAKTAAQADAAILALVNANNAGNTIALAAGAVSAITVGTTISSTATTSSDRNDTFNANTTATAASNATADDSFVFGGVNGDTIDGGFGTDTLNVAIDFAVTVAANSLKSVEILNIASKDDGATINVAEAKDATQIWNKGSDSNLGISAIKLGTTVGIDGSITAGKTTSFGFADAAGTADAATISLNAATHTGAVTIDSIETLTIANTGTSSVGSIAGNTLKAVVVTGSGELTANFAAGANTVVETVTATAYTGKITTDLTNLNAIKSYAGGTGIDAVTIDGAHTNDATINLGSGADTLSITAAGVESKTLTVTLGAGADIVTIGADLGNVQAIDTNANFIKTLITISDFNKSEDAIKLDTANGNATQDRETLLAAEQVQVDAAADLLAATKIVADTTAANKFAVFSYKGDTYIFDNEGTVGLQAGDSLIKITGVAAADLTTSNFELF